MLYVNYTSIKKKKLAMLTPMEMGLNFDIFHHGRMNTWRQCEGSGSLDELDTR